MVTGLKNKTIEKTIELNGDSVKKHLMVMVEGKQNHRKTIDANGSCKEKHYHPIAPGK